MGEMAVSSEFTAVGAKAQSREITYVGWSQEEAASRPTLAALFDGYRQSSGVTLDTVGYPWGQMQQDGLLRLRSRQPMDVVQLNERWVPQFAATNRLVDIDSVFGAPQLRSRISKG